MGTNTFHAIRVTEYWQRACVYYIRLDEFVHEFSIGVRHELDERDTPDTPYILVFDEEDKPAGTCRLHILDETHAKIERVSVLKQYRGSGAGRTVIQAAELWLKELGIQNVLINSREGAVGFYEKQGYKTDWETYQKGKLFGTVDTYKTLNLSPEIHS
ncbi:MAG: GNAT family N-acetyltransferase [bacterium]|nr:GNAT family N-acetyltransferase [bacterium]